MANGKQKKIAFGAMAASFLFFFNPNFIIIDVLPDWIGYVLLSHALVFFADLNDSIASALSSFRKMILVDGAKLLAIFWIFSMPNADEQSSSMLLWAFVFAVLEIMLLVPAYSRLFEGLIQLGNFHPNEAILGGAGRRQGSRTDRIRRVTVVFVIWKAVLSVLPELLDLGQISEFESSHHINLYQYVGLLRGAAMLAVLIFGIVWLCRCVHYVFRVSKDRTFVDSLTASYTDRVMPRVGLHVQRNLKAAFWILVFGVLMLTDFRLDMVNVLPDTLAAVLLLVYLIMACRSVHMKKALVLSIASVNLALALLSDASDYIFNVYYHTSSTLKEEALRAFYVTAVVRFLSLAVILTTLGSVLYSFLCAIREHTGNPVGVQSDHATEQGYTESYHKELRRKLLPILPCIALYAASEGFAILEPWFNSYYQRSFGLWIFLGIFCVILLTFSVYFAKEAIYDGIESKYLLE